MLLIPICFACFASLKGIVYIMHQWGVFQIFWLYFLLCVGDLLAAKISNIQCVIKRSF